MTKYLIMHVNSNDEYAEEPDAFITKLDESSLKVLRDYAKRLEGLNPTNFLHAEFFYDCGAWVNGYEWLEKNVVWKDEEYIVWEGELPEISLEEDKNGELEYFEGVSCELVSVDTNENFCFKFYGEYSGVEYYTAEVSLSEIDVVPSITSG